MPQTDLFASIGRQRDRLSKSELAIANLLATETDFALSASITRLAERAAVSPPTVTRFCRRLGCDSFADFKLRLAQAAFTGARYIRPQSPNRQAPPDVVAGAAAAALSSVQHSIDAHRLECAAQALANAGSIAAFGSGGNSPLVAAEIQNRLFRLGLKVTSCSDHSMQLMLASSMGQGDVVIGSSLSGRNLELVRAFSAARTYGAKVIAISRTATPVAEASDIHLPIDIVEGDNILVPSSARYGFMLMIDLLAYRVAQIREPVARETLRRIKFQLANERDANDREVLGD